MAGARVHFLDKLIHFNMDINDVKLEKIRLFSIGIYSHVFTLMPVFKSNR